MPRQDLRPGRAALDTEKQTPTETTHKPEAWDVLQLLRKHLDTTIATCTRKASAEVNDLATEVLVKDLRKTPLGTLPLDYEINDANFDKGGNLKAKIKLEPAVSDLHEGQRVFLTHNLDKENGFVNGMSAVIQSYDPASRCLGVLTKPGKTLAVHPYTEEVDKHSNVTSYLARLGYSTTAPQDSGRDSQARASVIGAA